MNRRAGFTLFEMAIVLAIVGLIAGGIVMGKNLVREQQVRNVLENASTYARAVYQFKDKYGELPGDFDNAVSLWGSDATYCTSSLDATGGTCNGNGDGIIDSTASIGTTAEMFQLWKQLQLAGFIQGSFSGVAGGASSKKGIAGFNVPAGPVKLSEYWYYSGWGVLTSDSSLFYAGDYRNVMAFISSYIPYAAGAGPVIIGKEAYEIDAKADDGFPGFGNIRAPSGNPGGCGSTNVARTAVYTKNGTSLNCDLYFMNTFDLPNPGQQ